MWLLPDLFKKYIMMQQNPKPGDGREQGQTAAGQEQDISGNQTVRRQDTDDSTRNDAFSSGTGGQQDRPDATGTQQNDDEGQNDTLGIP
jgi:hypothetical protein